jgi:iron complex outermembrane receptor protein
MQGLLLSPTSLGYAGIPGIINYNVLGRACAARCTWCPTRRTNDYNRNYYVEEKVPVFYVKFDINTAIGSVPACAATWACSGCTPTSPRRNPD